jgi:glycosyltransferase involved in cell wall biosynthesis
MKTAPGYRIRVDGLTKAMTRAGLKVDSIGINVGPFRSIEILSYVSKPNRAIVKSTLADDQSSVVFFGLQSAAILCTLSRKHFVNPKITVDVCDSWAKLSEIQTKKNGLKILLKRLLVRWVYRGLEKRVDKFTFISSLDLAHDARFLSRDVELAVVPNGVPDWCENNFLAAKGNPRTVLFVGSGHYPPNRDALESAIKLLRTEIEKSELRIKVIGDGWPKSDGESIQYLGWVDDLVGEYESAGATLALLQSGAGVSNKVIESLAIGRPVFASKMIFDLFGHIPGVHLANSETIPDLLKRLAAGSLESPSPDWKHPSWHDSVRGLFHYDS